MLNGFLLAAATLLNPNGYAHPVGKVLQKNGKNGDFISEVISTSKGNKYKFNKSLKALANHEVGLNMQHISTNRSLFARFCYILQKCQSLNTYEYRIHNSSLDLETWKQNIYLDSAISKIAYEMAYEPGKNDCKLSSFFDKSILEEEKAERFLELLFDNNEDRQIYKSRWESNKDAPVFKKANGFGKTFKKNDLKQIAKNTKSQDIVSTMQRLFSQAKDLLQNDNSFIKAENFVMDYGGRDDE